MAEKVAKRRISIYIDGSKVINSVKGIKGEMRKLINEQAQMTFGSDEYVAHARKIAQLESILQQHNDHQKEISKEFARMSGAADEFEKKSKKSFSLDSIASGIGKLKGAIIGFLASFTVDKAVDEFAKLDDAHANVQKYTGLTRSEIKELNSEFDKLDTRTATLRLNELAGEAGKLGIEGSKDILDFVDAANIIDVALGEDLGEDAIKSIGKLAQMFGDADRMGLKGAMLATGSAINEVAQNSNAAEPYLVDFTNRMAGIGKQADISIPKLIGFASVLDQNAQESEKSSTALSKLIVKLYQDPAKFATAAGLDIKEFSNLVKTDANEALLTLFDTLNKKGGLANLAPILKELKLEGSGASSTVAVLAGNVEKIRKEQQTATDAFMEGKSVINEYDVQNNTFTANLDKQKKVLLGYVTDIGEKLAPMVLEGASAGNMLLKVFTSLITILINNKEAVLTVVGAYLAYNAALKLQIAYHATYNAIATVSRLIRLANAGAIAIETGNTLRAAAAQKLYYTTLEKGGIVTKAYIAVTSLLSAAKAFLTGNIVAARAAMVQFNTVVSMNPIGALLAVITAVAGALYIYSKRTKEVTELQKSKENISKKVNDAYAEQEARINILVNRLNTENAALSKRKEALEELKKIIPGYHAELTKEGRLINNNTDAIKKYLIQFEKQIKLKAIEEELIELSKKERQQEIAYNEAFRKSTQVTRGDASVLEILGIQDYSQNRKKELDQANADLIETRNNIAALKSEMGKSIADDSEGDDILAKRKEFNLMNKKELERWIKDEKNAQSEYLLLANEILGQKKLTDDDSGGGSGDKSSKQREKVASAKIEMESELQKALSDIKQQYLDSDLLSNEEFNDKYTTGRILSEEKLNDLLLAKQDEFDTQRIAKLRELQKSTSDPKIQADLEKDIADIKAKSLDRQIADKNKKQKESLKDEQDLLKWNEEEDKKIVEASLKYIDNLQDKDVIDLMERRSKNLISEKQYQDELLKLELKYLEEKLRVNGLTEEEIAKIRQEILANQTKEMEDLKSQRDALFGDDFATTLMDKMKNIDDALKTGAISFQESILLRIHAVTEAFDIVSQTMTNLTSAEESAINRKYDKQIEAAEGNSKKQKKLEEKKQKEINAVRAKYADKQFAVQVAQVTSSTALAALQAYQAAMSLGPIGFVLGPIMAAAAIAYGASQIKVAKEQRDAAREGYFDGGYTGGNDPRTVRGHLPNGEPVHGMEFVANRHATNSNLLRPVFDVINEAQKHNTVSSLTKSDLAKALNIPTGYMQGGYNGVASSSPSIIRDLRNDEVYERFAGVLERLDEKMDKPFKGYVTYKGDNGIEEAELLNRKMIKNVSRS